MPRLHGIEATPRQQPGKELLRQLPRSIVITTLAAEEAEDRLPVSFAERAERGLRFGRFAPRAEDERPARRGEVAGRSVGSSGCHGYRSLDQAYLRRATSCQFVVPVAAALSPPLRPCA